MDYRTVIARAYGGEPLKRVATQAQKCLVYILNPMCHSESGGVGFPIQDVFIYDEDIFLTLCHQWGREGKTQPRNVGGT